MKRYTNFLIDLNGEPVVGGTVRVYEAFSTETDPEAVQMYNANEAIGANEIDNAGTDSVGKFFFYVPDGRYDIVASYTTLAGPQDTTLLDQLITEGGGESGEGILTQGGAVLVDQDGDVIIQAEA